MTASGLLKAWLQFPNPENDGLIEPIRALQKQKEIDPALDPQMIIVFLVSLVEGALTQNYGWEKSAPFDPDAYILKTMHWAEKVLQPNAH
ncbi:MAG: hypothetical protein AB7H48_06455 [Parachlamydiales bacterium]